MNDRYGREITDEGNGFFSVPGLTVQIENQSPEFAVQVFNSMQPEGWVEPFVLQPLNPTGALATLLAVTPTPSLEDIANAVGLNPEDLIAEAEAWSAAQQQNG